MTFALRINGQTRRVDAPPDQPLLWVLREQLGLKGPKYGCGIGACGACTVHIDGQAVRACVTPVNAVGQSLVTTIEGLAAKGTLHPVQQAWIEEDVAQCGYCQAGQIMAVASLLAETPSPSDEQIDAQITNLCRCGTYTRIRTAIHRAAKLMKQGAA
ncbi:MAG: (2Fe-2S)-binding protein [Phenylobacterium sp.]|uniref:(2Fe-2S)-binding protein n=1 Tax=Phenylobacterium sp. TaxID=1871053 RepID=UPI0025D35775|nr:(2Fe-2S)-binding protein [Phenylobacterium sp.]MBA4010448.1 (2Fe-2S)-binding protein [Phenylobacterium sp.]